MNDDVVKRRDLRSAPTRGSFTVIDTRSPRPDSFLKWYHLYAPDLVRGLEKESAKSSRDTASSAGHTNGETQS